MPVFVRSGAIIPMQPDMNYDGEKPVNPLTLDIYPSPASEFELYEDDGLTLDYQNGEYALTRIECRQDTDRILIDIHSPEGIFQLPDRTLVIKLHIEGKPIRINVDNRKVTESSSAITEDGANGSIPSWNYDRKNNLLYISCSQKSGRPVSVEIQYK
jgi:hypothetical protein